MLGVRDRELVRDGERQMRICNACRYCEGYCAVWQALEFRREVKESDLLYLSHLCHDCKECIFACPFSSPHSFGVNPPKLFAQIRKASQENWNVWPVLRNIKFYIGFLAAFVLLVLIVLAQHAGDSGVLWTAQQGPGAFYKVSSLLLMTSFFTVLGLWMLLMWIAGAWRFWRSMPSVDGSTEVSDWMRALRDAFRLRYLGKETPESRIELSRRRLHHLVFYGFLLDLASTTLGAIYTHVLNQQAPYPVYHPVVILGILGGIGIVIGCAEFVMYHLGQERRIRSSDHPVLPYARDAAADRFAMTFTVSLGLVALTGFLVLFLRATVLMPIALMVHLALVASLFFTAPYTKFAHFVYRYLALVRFEQEKRLRC